MNGVRTWSAALGTDVPPALHGASHEGPKGRRALTRCRVERRRLWFEFDLPAPSSAALPVVREFKLIEDGEDRGLEAIYVVQEAGRVLLRGAVEGHRRTEEGRSARFVDAGLGWGGSPTSMCACEHSGSVCACARARARSQNGRPKVETHAEDREGEEGRRVCEGGREVAGGSSRDRQVLLEYDCGCEAAFRRGELFGRQGHRSAVTRAPQPATVAGTGPAGGEGRTR